MFHYKLYYFDVRGSAEPIRMLFALAGEKFEDYRVNDEEWTTMKAKMPNGRMPVLEINGLQIAQSASILRYLAEKFGYTGKTLIEKAQVDACYEEFRDFRYEIHRFITVLRGKRPGDVKEAYLKWYVPAKKRLFNFLEIMLRKNGTGFLVGDSVTYADLVIAEYMNVLFRERPNELDAFPEV
ncbi:unnamed protein product, partial [Mesorhabditis belari]|uniref:glutathione transferase n=1 Tax=Mesorhabditis belari TaxID=2138241 RepID=A0AAF3FLJ8_9BILA